MWFVNDVVYLSRHSCHLLERNVVFLPPLVLFSCTGNVSLPLCKVWREKQNVCVDPRCGDGGWFVVAEAQAKLKIMATRQKWSRH